MTLDVMDGPGIALAAAVAVTYGVLAVLTGFGSRRRGHPVWVAVCSAALFPVAWTVWYVQDELLQRPHHMGR